MTGVIPLNLNLYKDLKLRVYRCQVIDSAACCLVTPPTGVPRPRGTHRGNLPHLCVQAGCNHRSNYHYAETKAKLDEEGEREREKKNNLDAVFANISTFFDLHCSS